MVHRPPEGGPSVPVGIVEIDRVQDRLHLHHEGPGGARQVARLAADDLRRVQPGDGLRRHRHPQAAPHGGVGAEVELQEMRHVAGPRGGVELRIHPVAVTHVIGIGEERRGQGHGPEPFGREPLRQEFQPAVEPLAQGTAAQRGHLCAGGRLHDLHLFEEDAAVAREHAQVHPPGVGQRDAGHFRRDGDDEAVPSVADPGLFQVAAVHVGGDLVDARALHEDAHPQHLLPGRHRLHPADDLAAHQPVDVAAEPAVVVDDTGAKLAQPVSERAHRSPPSPSSPPVRARRPAAASPACRAPSSRRRSAGRPLPGGRTSD